MDARLKRLLRGPLQQTVCQPLATGILDFTKRRVLPPQQYSRARCGYNYTPTPVTFSLGKDLQFLGAASVLCILPQRAL